MLRGIKDLTNGTKAGEEAAGGAFDVATGDAEGEEKLKDLVIGEAAKAGAGKALAEALAMPLKSGGDRSVHAFM